MTYKLVLTLEAERHLKEWGQVGTEENTPKNCHAI